MAVTWLSADRLFPAVINKFEKAEVLLDIGCGILPQKYVRPIVHICCEPFTQYVEHLKEKVKKEFDRSYVIVNATWSEAVKVFPSGSVDTVFLVDVIEHLEKDEALNLLKQTESIAKNQIALFTPLGFLPQHHSDGKDIWGLDGAAWQEHKSGWLPEDFDESWEIYASKIYHTADNLGRDFKTPYGAMWAIKTIKSESNGKNNKSKTKEYVRNITEMAIDIKINSVLWVISAVMRLALNIKRSSLIVTLHRVFLSIKNNEKVKGNEQVI